MTDKRLPVPLSTADIHNRLSSLEIWRASKDATDNLRHDQNLANFAEMKQESKEGFAAVAASIENNNKAILEKITDSNNKITTLYDERAGNRGAAAERSRLLKPVAQIGLAVISGGGLFELVKNFWPSK